MASWRPPNASDPDEDEEWRFLPLSEFDATLAGDLLDRYAHRWLELAHLPVERLGEVPDTVELVVADGWDDEDEPLGDGTKVLRLRSWYTGSTYWLPDWEGSAEAAGAWVDSVAELQAGNVDYDRRYGPTPWDDPGSVVAEGPDVGRDRPQGFSAVFDDDDPGESGVSLRLAVYEFSKEPTVADVAMVLDRLPHIPEAPEFVKVQAAERAERFSPREFFTWLAESSREAHTTEQPEPLRCDCGAALLDPSTWSGRAAVHCGRCGARWGVEVSDAEAWSIWALDVPGTSEGPASRDDR